MIPLRRRHDGSARPGTRRLTTVLPARPGVCLTARPRKEEIGKTNVDDIGGDVRHGVCVAIVFD